MTGRQTRLFCSLNDLATEMVALAESGYHYSFNVGNPDEITTLELAEMIITLPSSKSAILHEKLPPDHPTVCRSDISLAQKILGWWQKVELHEGLRLPLVCADIEPLVGIGIASDFA